MSTYNICFCEEIKYLPDINSYLDLWHTLDNMVFQIQVFLFPPWEHTLFIGTLLKLLSVYFQVEIRE